MSTHEGREVASGNNSQEEQLELVELVESVRPKRVEQEELPYIDFPFKFVPKVSQ